MKTLLLCAAAAAAAWNLGGCSLMSDEDRDFYGKGWIHPTELDADAPLHDRPTRTSTGPATANAPVSGSNGGGATLQDEDSGAPFLTPQPSR